MCAFGIGDELSVRITGNSTSLTQSLEDAQDGLNSVRNASGTTSGALQLVQNRLGEVEDELSAVEREADSTNRSFLALSAGSQGLSASMGVLSGSLVATAIPAFLTLSTVVAPLAVVFGGIAAAAASLGAVFGGLALVGVITHMDELQTAMSQAREEIMLIIEPLGDVFGPLLVDAVEALPDLVQAVVNSLGPMDEFRNTLINFGDAAMDLIPQITGGMFELARQALPALNSALEWFVSSGGGAFQTMEESFARIYPLVAELGTALMDVAPTMLEFGNHVAELVVPALSDMVDSLNSVMAAVNELSPNMQNLVTTAVLLAPVLSAVATVLTGLSAPVLALVAAVGALAVAFRTDFMGIRTMTEEYLPTLEEMQTIAQEAFSEFMNLVDQTADFLQPLTEEIVAMGEALLDAGEAMLADISPALNSLNNAFTENEEEIMAFATAVRGALSGFVNFLRTMVLPAVQLVFGRVIAPLVNRLAGAFADNLGPVLSEVAQTMNHSVGVYKDVGDVLMSVWESIDHIVMPIIDYLVQQVGTLLVGAFDMVAEAAKFFMNLIQGDFSGALDNMGNAVDIVMNTFGSLGSRMMDALGNAVKPITDATMDIYNAVVESFTSLPSDLADMFVNAFSGLQGMVNSALGLPWKISIPGVTVAGREVFAGGSITVPKFGGSGGSSSIDNPGALTEQSDRRLENLADRAAMQQLDSVNNTSPSATRPTDIEVRVEGDTEVIKNAAVEVVDEQKRRTRRNSGRTNSGL